MRSSKNRLSLNKKGRRCAWKSGFSLSTVFHNCTTNLLLASSSPSAFHASPFVTRTERANSARNCPPPRSRTLLHIFDSDRTYAVYRNVTRSRFLAGESGFSTYCYCHFLPNRTVGRVANKSLRILQLTCKFNGSGYIRREGRSSFFCTVRSKQAAWQVSACCSYLNNLLDFINEYLSPFRL